jgi:hypothetical protein
MNLKKDPSHGHDAGPVMDAATIQRVRFMCIARWTDSTMLASVVNWNWPSSLVDAASSDCDSIVRVRVSAAGGLRCGSGAAAGARMRWQRQ